MAMEGTKIGAFDGLARGPIAHLRLHSGRAVDQSFTNRVSACAFSYSYLPLPPPSPWLNTFSKPPPQIFVCALFVLFFRALSQITGKASTAKVAKRLTETRTCRFHPECDRCSTSPRRYRVRRAIRYMKIYSCNLQAGPA